MLAVTTTQTFCILDEESGQLWQIDSGKGVYYGVSFSSTRLYVGARQAEYGGDRNSQRNVILCYTPDLRLERMLKSPFALRDIHQILVDGETLYACSTYDEAVAVCDLRTGDWHAWHPFVNEAAGHGSDHINSITIAGEDILLAGNMPRGWIATFNKTTRRLSGDRQWLGHETHNVWLERGRLHICSSGDSAILDAGGVRHGLARGAWFRGYCAKGERRFVGLSEALIRQDRAFSDCVIAEYNGNYQLVGSFWLPGMGMAHDLRTLDVPDPSHNGLTFPLDRGRLDKRFFKKTLEPSLGSFAAA